MKMKPYLFFKGNCAEAIAFYQDVLGAEVRSFVKSDDVPGTSSEAAAHVMHAELAIGDTSLFLSDGNGANSAAASRFAISLQTSSELEAETLFADLAEGGAITVPLMTTPFASKFGMATDRFGTPWMVMAQAEAAF